MGVPRKAIPSPINRGARLSSDQLNPILLFLMLLLLLIFLLLLLLFLFSFRTHATPQIPNAQKTRMPNPSARRLYIGRLSVEALAASSRA